MANATCNKGVVSVKIWDPFLRVLHWWLAITLMAQFATGTIFFVWGDELSNAMMFGVNVPHFYIGYAFATALALRIVLLFVGPQTSRWRDLLPLTPNQRRDWQKTFLYYITLFRRPCPPSLGHNAFAGPAYIIFFLIAAAQVAIGIFLSFMPGGTTQMNSPWMTVHEYLFFALIAFVVVHLAAVVAREINGRNNIASAMIHGYKEFTEAEYKELILNHDENNNPSFTAGDISHAHTDNG
ncbi:MULTISPECIES: cytochrome b/b6 domain-containing protein [Acidithiobacillus]|uniref:Ni/Fe hydrogenase n=2 Tax=Acidithiobacillus TaxID=119977 RepID=A0A179BBQ8_ACIFR|nr:MULTISPECIES: cytochrome b/b6 domain-containing protein [Acidithiobacillus]MBU2854103.1 cytochrome b/b6 domain-containing protein [Acidithiobacillus ferriphilus]MEB8487935.1 cytochrome b/b6 domain-containing protein [Acidithiobacillus ferriphilus]MEB8489043.1 cytochrome b/b6 domain-containing protein [Acidithiobacillus ferriphilus]MEB8491810.1 cytochrome b/b6 domain-containing protein [Acidithiobacillus ferriphilus]MEB8513966.1 cytochrome b/b6 domain-containing protein [Acidithiobacillus fe